MSQRERYEVLILGSGFGGKLLAWHLAQSGRRTAVVERRWIGGSCPNIACLPSKNVIHSAQIAALFERGPEFGMLADKWSVSMPRVRARKREMVEGLLQVHRDNFARNKVEVVMGAGRFISDRTLNVVKGQWRNLQLFFAWSRRSLSRPSFCRPFVPSVMQALQSVLLTLAIVDSASRGYS